MKFTLLAVFALTLFVFNVTVFAQTNDEAKKAFVNWKDKAVAQEAGNSVKFQGFGVAVKKLEKGAEATFYVGADKTLKAFGATDFIVQPMVMTKMENGSYSSKDIGEAATLRSPRIDLKGLPESERQLSPRIVFVTPPEANAVRITLKGVWGEKSSPQIVLWLKPEITTAALGSTF